MAIYQQKLSQKPPLAQITAWRWMLDNLFSTPLNTVLSLFLLYLLFLISVPLLNWTLFDATFSTINNAKCSTDGACWVYIGEKINLFIYGFYPEEAYWRPNLTIALAFLFVITAKFSAKIHRFKIIISLLIAYPFIAFTLLYGGLGLDIIQTHKWGGLLLTIVVAAVGIVASFPIGIFLALGRQSKLQIIRIFSIIYIEFIRGVPLITILFMASVVLPLFFAEGVEFDKLLRALIGITLFQAAYIAEVIRGGLQAIPKGQYEAADALGLGFLQKTFLIILPQALKVAIPNIVGSFIALFKDTTLVLIIGLFDMLAMVRLTTSDVNWLGLETEGYIFVSAVLWGILYSMSRYCKKLEYRFNTENA